MTLRQRLLLTLAPSLLLLAALGGVGTFLLDRVSGRIGAILSENYDSVVFMVQLNEALERIDSSFNYALLGEEIRARAEYLSHWKVFDEQFRLEKNNITIPGEGKLVAKLEALKGQYRAAGDRFYNPRHPKNDRPRDYLGRPGEPGLAQQFNEIKRVTEAIRELNQQAMVDASHEARRTALVSQVAFAIGLATAVALAALLLWNTIRTVVRPIERMTQSALAIGGGDLDQTVPVQSHDEVGSLADAFNRMARQLRDFRRTHLSQLLRAQRTSQAAIDSFPDPILVLDPEGLVEMANPSAQKLLGVVPERIRPANTVATPWQPPPALATPLRNALTRQEPFLTQAFEQTVTFRVAGEERAYLPQILPIKDPYGGTLGAAVVLSDVTRFRLLDQIKSDLVATVSHELKTPLTSVRLVLHLLLEETVGPLTNKQTELLVDARDNAERLLQMIEHLLALARLEQGHDSSDIRPHSPQSLLQAAVDTARARADAMHVELLVEAPPDLPLLPVDATRIGHALNNLLDNALTYTPEGGHITLKAEPTPDGAVRITVSDTGCGIPAEYLPHVFDRFFRVPGQSKGQGTGLGLAIVQEIVTAHHGSITCTSEPGKGTGFSLTIPAIAAPVGEGCP